MLGFQAIKKRKTTHVGSGNQAVMILRLTTARSKQLLGREVPEYVEAAFQLDTFVRVMIEKVQNVTKQHLESLKRDW